MKKFVTIVLATILLALCFFAYAAAESKTASTASIGLDSTNTPHSIISFHQFD